MYTVFQSFSDNFDLATSNLFSLFNFGLSLPIGLMCLLSMFEKSLNCKNFIIHLAPTVCTCLEIFGCIYKSYTSQSKGQDLCPYPQPRAPWPNHSQRTTFSHLQLEFLLLDGMDVFCLPSRQESDSKRPKPIFTHVQQENIIELGLNDVICRIKHRNE